MAKDKPEPKGKHPGGRPKGSGKGKRGQARPGGSRTYRVANKPCPALAKPGHGTDWDCDQCHNTGEVPNR